MCILLDRNRSASHFTWIEMALSQGSSSSAKANIEQGTSSMETEMQGLSRQGRARAAANITHTLTCTQTLVDKRAALWQLMNEGRGDSAVSNCRLGFVAAVTIVCKQRDVTAARFALTELRAEPIPTELKKELGKALRDLIVTYILDDQAMTRLEFNEALETAANTHSNSEGLDKTIRSQLLNTWHHQTQGKYTKSTARRPRRSKEQTRLAAKVGSQSSA
jgi:hypothetical protein